MWSRALHVTVGHYPSGSWHVALVETEYRRGIPRDRELVVDVISSEQEVFRTVQRALLELMRRELDDRAAESSAGELEPLAGRTPAAR
jgi:hypothetical protein